jgi:hyperosmotically inducible periplasmic protein
MRNRSVVTAGVLLGALLLAGPSFAADKARPVPGSTAYIIREARHELITLPFYTVFDNLDYRVDGGVITLMGQVTRPVLKSDAENVVKNIEGVTKVVNDIKVLPLSPMDDDIRIAEFRKLYEFSSPLFRYVEGAIPQIHIIVDNGNVTLVGYVLNQGDKEIAGIRAGEVPDVFAVKNDLIVVK